jgi:hypothetical protein
VRQNLLAIGIGFLAAIFGTVLHQSTTGPQIPLGLIFALAIVLVAAVEVRTLSKKLFPGVLFSLSLAATIFLAAQDLTGDKLIPLNDSGLIWSYGSIGVAILVSAFPRIENRS